MKLLLEENIVDSFFFHSDYLRCQARVSNNCDFVIFSLETAIRLELRGWVGVIHFLQ
jgi:hypothetical protein